MIWLIAGIGIAIGLSAVVTGYRGKIIDDHPWCRKCKYDLFGSKEDLSICPECGSNLKHSNSIRVGHRKKRKLPLCIGLLLILISISIGGFLTYEEAGSVNWYPYKPFWLLQIDMHSDNATKASATQSEIIRRLKEIFLTTSQIDSIIDEALIAQPNPNATWLTMWGDFIETAWEMKLIDNERISPYLKNAAEQSLTLRHRHNIRQGSSMTIWMWRNNTRMGSKGGKFTTHQENTKIYLDNEHELWRGGGGGSGGLSSSGGGGSGPGCRFTQELGKHKLTRKFKCIIVPTFTIKQDSNMTEDEQREYRQVQIKKNTIVSWDMVLESTVEIVSDDQPLVEEDNDPEMKDLIFNSINSISCRAIKTRDYVKPVCSLVGRDFPMPVAFDVYWRIGEKEWKVEAVVSSSLSGSSLLQRSQNDRSVIRKLHDFPDNTDKIDIILRSNPFLGDEMIDVTEIWGGEIIFEDVDLEWQER